MAGARDVQRCTPAMSDAVAHFEAVDEPDRHHHLVCVRCGEVHNLPADVLGEIGVRLAERHGFHIGTVDLMIQGECVRCRGLRPGGDGSAGREPVARAG